MKIYMAPLEGITTYLYRNLHHKYFGGVDKYFTPFLSPGPNQGLSVKEAKDALPENNQGMPLVPQVLTNRAEDFLNAAKVLGAYGYREINLNLGCPSGTVTAKKKGSGLLLYPDELDAMLGQIFSDPDVAAGNIEVSIKTRVGKNSPEEWPGLLDIYSQYPLKELIVHPRIQKDFYKNTPNDGCFALALEKSPSPVVYNGDIFTEEACQRLTEKFPKVETVMLGRGLIRDPALAEKIGGPGKPEWRGRESARLCAFHDELLDGYCRIMSGERPVLFKMKEIWSYMIEVFPGREKAAKRIRKAVRLSEYRQAANEILCGEFGCFEGENR